MIKIISSHSFVDIITNSSTELFVCNTDKSAEFVTEIIRTLLDAYNKTTGCSLIVEDICSVSVINTNEDIAAHKEEYDSWATIYDDYKQSSFMGFADYKSREINNVSIGDIIILGTGDNSIPYEIWDTINRLFDGNNYHLG